MKRANETTPPGGRRPVLLAALLVAALLTAVLLTAVLLGGCVDAESLGGAPPTVVQVGSPPLWSNGVQTLMQLKCGVCHQVPAAPISPAGIPQTFDLNYHILSPTGVPGAQDATVLTALTGGILRMPVAGVGPMPPLYATPLAAAELQALEDWATAGGP
jgi:hypothetical protein